MPADTEYSVIEGGSCIFEPSAISYQLSGI